MSTQGIRNFIDEVGDRCPELRDLALREVEAIEKAAKSLTAGMRDGLPEPFSPRMAADMRNATQILVTIAKESP